MLFRKKKVTPPDIGQEEINEIQEQVDSGSIDQEPTPVPSGYAGAPSGYMGADLEKVKAQIESLNQARQANNERFVRIGEQIGELRTMIIDNEKKMTDVEVKAIKAHDLVFEVQPENLKADVGKVDAKIEAVKARVLEMQKFSRALIEEIKKVKNDVNVFRGAESILKLNDDVKKELISIQKTRGIVEGHADKVEEIFIETQKNYSDYQKLDSQLKQANKTLEKLQRDFNSLKIQVEKTPNKADLVDIRSLVVKNEDMIKDYYGEIAKTQKLVDTLKIVESRLLDLIAKNKKNVSTLKSNLMDTNKNMDKLSKKSDIKEIKSINIRLDEHSEEIDHVLDLIEKIEKKMK